MKKVIIIGAGPAGLTAALEILQKSNNMNVLVLEETGAVGGISKTVSYQGNRMDLGGHRFFSKNQQVIDWWKAILPMQVTDRVSHILFGHKFYAYPIQLTLETLKNMGP